MNASSALEAKWFPARRSIVLEDGQVSNSFAVTASCSQVNYEHEAA